MNIKQTITLHILSFFIGHAVSAMQMTDTIPVMVANQSNKFVGIIYSDGAKEIESSALPFEDIELGNLKKDYLNVRLYNGISKFTITKFSKGTANIGRIDMIQDNTGKWQRKNKHTEGPVLNKIKKLIILIRPDNSVQLLAGE